MERKACIKRLYVYPIKSCGGFCVPDGFSWPVASNSLYLDRNWAIITPKGSINGKLVWRVLHCKQDTSMARICVSLDFPDGNDNFLVNIRNKGDLNSNSYYPFICTWYENDMLSAAARGRRH